MNTLDKAKTPTTVAANKKKYSIYDIAINGLDGKPISLKTFRGKKILFVNVASECGFTNQYKELQSLSDTYADKLVVIGSPCNQFGKQEPGNASQIQEFCELNFGVTFLLTEKIAVKGSNQHPLYEWLTSKKLNGKKSSSVKWNFQKYLVDEKGNLIDYYFSITKPMSSKITKHL
ncbi:glutathione peroxidase [Aequorivita sublithincola DSM 14238]|uniref:Glutathione peroxidase n=1 Tax=Aequorivita sublithincola (strain DSM 14238 / LMG 21431 / ACAM 643 / 9-3) TaxID=746697 RepID=I3YX80_AEQSU|nr:glutathione peroxidase [Aequorivita sublithincola]AFL81598.1 glutathione peroxidase [Aequorivita sublithincola DSM 14238]